MKKRKLLLVLPALFLLASCGNGGETTAGPTGNTTTTPKPETTTTPKPETTTTPKPETTTKPATPEPIIPSYDGVTGDPKPILLPKKAPKDYEGFTPLDVTDDAFAAYTFIDHALANSDFYSVTSGTTTTNVLGLDYVQNITSLRAFVGTTGFNQVTALAENSVAGLSVNTVEQRYEDVDAGHYGYRKGDSKTCTIDEDNVATVGKWEGWDAGVDSRPTFLETFGHDICGLTNYYVPSADYIESGRMESMATDSYEFSFDFSVAEGKNAGQYYLREQQHMIAAAGIGATNVDLTIETLHVEVTVDSDFLPKRMTVVETYTGQIAGVQALKLTSNLTTEFHVFEGETIPDDRVQAIFDEAKEAFKGN